MKEFFIGIFISILISIKIIIGGWALYILINYIYEFLDYLESIKRNLGIYFSMFLLLVIGNIPFGIYLYKK